MASAFANCELYLVLANYNRDPIELETAANYLTVDQSSAKATNRWQLAPRSLRILRRSV